ncbi:hypothetical protein ElyMa_001483300 [Elysia marginata]|uniref:Uncharacterized protein n=1 Tax=Elysia marginata TaxID=1093978 RepID=A0AAV4J4S0_9GAST|nr:hypothetical protein ElyMa_001483300 [Elysia marginata]
MNHSQMSADLGMYSGYMPPPTSYGESQNYMHTQYPHQQPMAQHQQQPLMLNQHQQQPIMLGQHQQQPVMQNQQQHHQFNTDSYNAPIDLPHPTKQNAMHTKAQSQGQRYLSQPPQAHQYQGHVSTMQWGNPQSKIPPIPPLSPSSNSTVQFPRSSPQHIQQAMVIPQRHSSNASPMHGVIQQHNPHPPPLSPMQGVNPRNSQMSPGPHQFSQTSASTDARTMNHVRRLSTANEFTSQQSVSISTASPSLTGLYTSGKMALQQSQPVHNLPAPIPPQAHQGAFNTQQHTHAFQPDPSFQPCSKPSLYPTMAPNFISTMRQSNSSHAQLPHSNVHPSAQNLCNLNQMNQVGERHEPQQGHKQIYFTKNAGNILNANLPSSTSILSPSSESHGVKTVSVSSVNAFNTSIGSRNNLSNHPFSVAVDNNGRVASSEQGFFPRPSPMVTNFSAHDQLSNLSWTGIPSDGRPTSQTSNFGGRGSRGGRGAPASRALGRGAQRGRGRGRGRGEVLRETNPVPIQPWCLPSNSSTSSFQSDIEAMQAGVMADMASSFQSTHPVEAVKESQPNKVQPKSSLSVGNSSSRKDTSDSSRSTSHTSAPASTTSTASASRAAALEAIRIKQEAVESMAKAKNVLPHQDQINQKSKEESSRPTTVNISQAPFNKANCDSMSAGQTGRSSQRAGLIHQRVSSYSSTEPHSTTTIMSSQPPNKSLSNEQTPECSDRVDKGTHDSLAGLLNASTSVERKIPQHVASKKVDPSPNQVEKLPQVQRQNSVPLVKSTSANIGKAILQRSVSNVTKSNFKTHSQPGRKVPVRQNVSTADAAYPRHQNMSTENKRPMTAKERVISMWRDGQVVGRNPTLLKRVAKVNDNPQPPLQSGEPLSKPHSKTLSFEIDSPQHIESDSGAPIPKKPKQTPTEEIKTVPSKSKLDLYYIMFHGHKLICLKSAREKMLLLCQFQFECFPDKGMGSVNNCIDRSLRIKKKPLQHRLQSDIVSYLKKNDYKIDSGVLTINLEDARRVYHHMYNIRNCVSASCVVALLDQPVDLLHVIPGSKKRTFQREILGRIKTEAESGDDDLNGNQKKPDGSMSKSKAAGRDENAATEGLQKTGDVGEEDARSDCTVAYGADKSAEEDDVVIVSVDENPNMICYNSDGPKVGMLCNSLMGTVRSYVHNNEHYLIIEDLCKIFGASDFNALLDNQNITVYSCCPEIGAFLNQISDKFPAVSSFHECLVKEKDIGVQWANDQPGPEYCTDVTSTGRPSMKEEIIEGHSSQDCSPPKQPKMSAPITSSPKRINSESDLDSCEPRLQIDMGNSPEASKENVSIRGSTAIMAVNQPKASKEKATNLDPQQTGREPPVSSSPESHSSAETMASLLALDVSTSNTAENGLQKEQATSLSSTSCKDSIKEQEKKKDAQVNASNSAHDTVQRETENIAGSTGTSVSSSSAINISSSQQEQNSTGWAIVDSFLLPAPESPSDVGIKTKSYSELCQMNKTLIGIVQSLRKELAAVKHELAVTKSAKDKAEKVSKHLEGWKVFRGSAKIRGSVSYELGPSTARLATAVVLILCKNRGQTLLKTAVRKSKVLGFDIATGSSFLLSCVSISASVAKISLMHRAYT